MFVGRVGVLSVLSIFITKKGELNFRESVSEFKFNPEEPQLRR